MELYNFYKCSEQVSAHINLKTGYSGEQTVMSGNFYLYPFHMQMEITKMAKITTIKVDIVKIACTDFSSLECQRYGSQCKDMLPLCSMKMDSITFGDVCNSIQCHQGSLEYLPMITAQIYGKHKNEKTQHKSNQFYSLPVGTFLHIVHGASLHPLEFLFISVQFCLSVFQYMLESLQVYYILVLSPSPKRNC